MATLTFVYSDSTAVVGPLATNREPHSWDLCVNHAGRITAPRGWELVRHPGPLGPPPEDDDLVALADAVREADQAVAAPAGGRLQRGGAAEPSPRGREAGASVLAPAPLPVKSTGRRRGHLRVLPDPSE